MKILFRVDAGSKIGLGHYFRSLNLAEQLQIRGHEVFYSHLKSEYWDSEIKKGFKFENITFDKDDEENRTYEFILENNIQIYYVDSIIDFSDTYISKLKKYVKVIFYQNLSASKHLSDIFILPSIHQDDEFFLPFSSDTEIFKGLDYLLFNSEISLLEPKNKYDPIISSIAIAAGGSDPKNTLLKIYELIKSLNIDNILFTFCFGVDYLFKENIPKVLPPNIKFRIFNHSDIIEHDLLISSFGVSTYEFLYLGMPIISYGHQKSNATASDMLAMKIQSFISLGNIDDITSLDLVKAINKIANVQFRKELTNNAKQYIDLKGADRIINIIESAN